jgi:polysaccharide biosynthesis protein PslH
MRILQLCNKVPFPPTDGGCMAMNNLTQGLIKHGVAVKVLAINTAKHFVDLNKIEQKYRAQTAIEAIFVDTRVKLIPAFLNLFQQNSYNIQRFYSKEFEQKLIEVLRNEKFDVVQLESLYMAVYAPVIKRYNKAKIVLRAHNIEHQLWQRLALNAKNPLKKWYLNFLANRLQQFQKSILKEIDAVASITTQDGNYFKQIDFKGALLTLPFGIEIKMQANILQNQIPNSIFHIGAMDWQPNVEALNWFIKEIFPLILTKMPNVKLYLAGRKMPIDFMKINHSNINVLGEVSSAEEFMLSHQLMVVPLLSGGGMRVKIIEAMALGKAIVATTLAVEGIEGVSGKHFEVANDAESFANAVVLCLSNQLYQQQLEQDAKQFVNENYNNELICKNLLHFYNRIITH